MSLVNDRYGRRGGAKRPAELSPEQQITKRYFEAATKTAEASRKVLEATGKRPLQCSEIDMSRHPQLFRDWHEAHAEYVKSIEALRAGDPMLRSIR